MRPGPVVLERGRGSHVWDLDGNEYVDFMMSFGALIQGHAHPKIVEVVSQTIAGRFALCRRDSGRTRRGGTVSAAWCPARRRALHQQRQRGHHAGLRLARAHTGRNKFLKFEGHYHGWYDPYCLNGHSHPADQLGPKENPARFPDSAGIPDSVFDDVVLAPWNDIEALEAILRQHGRELAAIITEPIMANMGCILPREGYLQKVCDLAHRYGALFILDEVVTGFRYGPGGCQQHFGLKPDLSTFGKALGAGFPIGAVAGPRAILDRMRWDAENMVLHYGTFNGHRLTMRVIAANLDLLMANGGGVYSQLYAVGDAAIAGLRDIFHAKKHCRASCRVSVRCSRSTLLIERRNRRLSRLLPICRHGRYSRFVHGLLDCGIYMTPSNGLHWIISTAHTKEDVELLLSAADEVCAELT